MSKENQARQDRFRSVCMDYILRFCEKHDLNFEGWVGDRVGETAEIGDMFLDFSDIRYDTLAPTIITTNLDKKDIRGRYRDRVADRFNEMFELIGFKTKSYRR